MCTPSRKGKKIILHDRSFGCYRTNFVSTLLDDSTLPFLLSNKSFQLIPPQVLDEATYRYGTSCLCYIWWFGSAPTYHHQCEVFTTHLGCSEEKRLTNSALVLFVTSFFLEDRASLGYATCIPSHPPFLDHFPLVSPCLGLSAVHLQYPTCLCSDVSVFSSKSDLWSTIDIPNTFRVGLTNSRGSNQPWSYMPLPWSTISALVLMISSSKNVCDIVHG